VRVTRRKPATRLPRRFSGENLRQARVDAGLRKEDLASRAECSYPSVHSYEVGKSAPSANILARLADVLGISIDSLFTTEPEGQR
jgi:transcriptional regulator with XRE-family HTH domain